MEYEICEWTLIGRVLVLFESSPLICEDDTVTTSMCGALTRAGGHTWALACQHHWVAALTLLSSSCVICQAYVQEVMTEMRVSTKSVANMQNA